VLFCCSSRKEAEREKDEKGWLELAVALPGSCCRNSGVFSAAYASPVCNADFIAGCRWASIRFGFQINSLARPKERLYFGGALLSKGGYSVSGSPFVTSACQTMFERCEYSLAREVRSVVRFGKGSRHRWIPERVGQLVGSNSILRFVWARLDLELWSLASSSGALRRQQFYCFIDFCSSLGWSDRCDVTSGNPERSMVAVASRK
jgi:hypothetical protein